MAGVREYKVQRRDMPLVIGLAVLWFSLQASPYYPLVMSPFFQDADIAAVSLNHMVYAVALTAACVVLMVLLRRAPVRAWLHSSRLPVLCAALGAVASLVMYGAPVAGDTWTFLAPAVPLVTRCASVVVALYVAACCMAFLGRLCAYDTRTVVVALGLSYVLFSIVFLALTLLDERALSLCLALCPLVALGCLLIGARMDEAAGASEEGAPTPAATAAPVASAVPAGRVAWLSLPWGFIVLCVAFIYFGVTSVRVFTAMGIGLAQMGTLNVAAHVLTAVVSAALVAAFAAGLVRKGIVLSNFISIVALVALLYMGSLLVVTLGDPAGVYVLVGKRVLVAAEHSAEVLLLMALLTEAVHRRMAPWLLIGAYGIVVCAGPQFFALDVLYATGVLGVLAEMPLTTPLAAVGAFAIAAAAIVLLVAHSRDNAAQASAQGDTWQTDLCRQATVSYDITPREFDVVVYTYRGYSARKIAETLLVSESTVKAHLSHCYRKLGIHTKQELIALVDSYRIR